MARSVQLSEQAYATLTALKRKGESYSDVVLRMASERKDPKRLLRLVGRGRATGDEAFRRKMRDADAERWRILERRRGGAGS